VRCGWGVLYALVRDGTGWSIADEVILWVQ
jgi:hypothetical protein